ncbi:MAG: PilT/PilU family type 4a pilus ATPase [Candidatus Paceibacterota bacterium]
MDYSKLLEELFEIMLHEGASDIHFSSGKHPTIRIHGTLVPIKSKEEFKPEDTLGLVQELVSESDFERFEERNEIDFAYDYKGKARFRGNAFFQQDVAGVALRLIPGQVKTIEELGLPPILKDFTRKKQGFFLTVGPIGQGKSTTLASMVDLINTERAEHILTIEDPVEFVFEPKRSIINQRQVGVDTTGFHEALMSAFRQDVNVIMVGEMRGSNTMGAAVTAAETGHLVYSTLHTNDASQTIDRIIGSFSAEEQNQVRSQLSSSLTAILSQRLIPKIGGGMVPAVELLINNNAVSNLIRENRTHEIQSVIETGLEQGMISMNRSLAELVRSGLISLENAQRHSNDQRGLLNLIS